MQKPLKVVSFQQTPDLPAWWLLEVEGHEGRLLVGNNWVNTNGILQPGDEVLMDISKYLHYANSPYKFVLNMKKTAKEAVIE